LFFFGVRGWSAAGQNQKKKKKNHLQLGGLSFCKLVEVRNKSLVWFFFFFFWFLFLGGALLECRRSPTSPPPTTTVFPKIGFSHQTTPSPTRVAKFATNALSTPLPCLPSCSSALLLLPPLVLFLIRSSKSTEPVR
jgi:hypothetical protein